MKRLLLLLVLGATTPLLAQDPVEEVAVVPFRTSYFPYLTSTPNDGVFGVARIIRYQQAPWDARVTNFVEQSLDAGYSTRGSYFVRGDYRKLMADQVWRVRARIEASRDARFGRSDSFPKAYYHVEEFVRRDRQQGWVDLTRRVTGPLHVALRGAVDHQSYRGNRWELGARFPDTPIEGPVIACVTTPCPEAYRGTVAQTDAQLRAALVLDTRNNEYDPNKGVLVELGAFTGSGGEGYTGSYGVARGWLPLHRLTRLTARIGYRKTAETAAVGIHQEVPAWESPFLTIGGPNSHRAIEAGALSGRYVQFAGAEVRHTLLDFGGLGAITALAFVDAGRDASRIEYLFITEPTCQACATLREPRERAPWTVGAGGGLGIRVLRAAQLNVTAAKANGSMRWYVSSGWSW